MHFWLFRSEGLRAMPFALAKTVDFRYPSVHPDGYHIIFSTQNEAPPEVWMMENFLPKAEERK
jgi:hypothetical protein